MNPSKGLAATPEQVYPYRPTAERFVQLRIGPYRLDLSARSLLRNDQLVELTPKAVEALRVLVQHSGTVVSKESLLATIWPGTFVEEGSLSRNICALRQALGETWGVAAIQTIPRRGYRFKPAAQLHEESSDGRRESLFVLPFREFDICGTQKLGVRLNHAIVVRLASLKRFRVHATGFAGLATQRDGTKHSEARDDPDLALTGSIQQQDGIVRVTAELAERTSQTTVWAEYFEEDAADVFHLVDSVAEQIAGALALLLNREQRKLLSSQYAKSRGRLSALPARALPLVPAFRVAPPPCKRVFPEGTRG